MKKLLFFLASLLTSTVGLGQQQAVYYEGAKKAYLDAAAKTKCPEKARVLREYADWYQCAVDRLAKGGPCGNQPTTPIPPCEGDLTGGLDYPGNKQTNNVSSESGKISDATFNSAAQTVFNLIDQGKRNKWNKKYIEKADNFYQTYGVTIDAIQNAIETNDTTAMQTIIKKGININIDFIDQTKTILYYAAEKNNYDIAEMLIKAGADVNKGTLETPDLYGGITPLHAAVINGSLDMVYLLISNDARINAQEQFTKTTPMHRAVEQNKLEIIQFLKNSGANLNLENNLEGYGGFNRHLTPSRYAKKLGHEKAARILEGTERIDYKIKKKKVTKIKNVTIISQKLKASIDLYFRDAPNSNGHILTNIKKDTELVSSRKIDNYWEVTYNNTIGYVSEMFVDTISNTLKINEKKLPSKFENTTENKSELKTSIDTYFRDTPNSDGNILLTISKGTKLISSKKIGQYWEVSYNNKVGYVSEMFVDEILNDAQSYKENLQDKKENVFKRKLKVSADTYLRNAPNVDGKRLLTLKKGTELVTSRKTDGYWEVTYSNKFGYVSEMLVDEIP